MPDDPKVDITSRIGPGSSYMHDRQQPLNDTATTTVFYRNDAGAKEEIAAKALVGHGMPTAWPVSGLPLARTEVINLDGPRSVAVGQYRNPRWRRIQIDEMTDTVVSQRQLRWLTFKRVSDNLTPVRLEDAQEGDLELHDAPNGQGNEVGFPVSDVVRTFTIIRPVQNLVLAQWTVYDSMASTINPATYSLKLDDTSTTFGRYTLRFDGANPVHRKSGGVAQTLLAFQYSYSRYEWRYQEYFRTDPTEQPANKHVIETFEYPIASSWTPHL